MKENNQLFKGSVNTILLKLLNEHDRMYGYEITKIVKELSNGQLKLTEGALYPALHKMEAEGLVEVSVENIGNRVRKYYSLTRGGKKEMRYKLAELEDFLSQLQQILNLKLAR